MQPLLDDLSANRATELPKPEPQPKLEGLTALRGLAAWWVVAYHFREALPPFVGPTVVEIASHGYLAVDIFFVMSGFIIGLNYADRFTTLRLGEFRRFFVLRIARIYPLHIFMLLLFLLMFEAKRFVHASLAGRPAFNPFDIPDAHYFLLSVALAQNWGFEDQLDWNVPAWSISTEMLAYVAFPLIAYLVVRSARKPLFPFAAIVALLLAYAVGSIFIDGLSTDITRFGLLRCIIEFTAGVCLHRLWADLPRNQWIPGVAVGLGCLLLTASVGFGASDALVVPLGAICIIYGLAAPGAAPERLLSRPLLIRLGVLSYSVYLVHYLGKDFIKLALVRDGIPAWLPFPAYILLVAAASEWLYANIEVPGRRALRASAS